MDMRNWCSVQTMIEDLMEKSPGVAVFVRKLSAVIQQLCINQLQPILLCTDQRGFHLQRNPMSVVSVGKPSATSLNSLGIREVTQERNLMDALTVGKPFHISQHLLSTREFTLG